MAKKRPAIILDRDGVLTQRPFLTWRKDQLKLSEGIAKEIKFFNRNKIPVIIITNQPVVARGWITEKGVERLHNILQKRLKRQGAFIDKFYLCPHHPNATIKKYRTVCKCRKPNTGMFKLAAKEFNIDLRRSVMIGDMTKDILSGKKAGTTTILVKSGHGGSDKKYKVKPDYKISSPREALKLSKKILLKNLTN